MPIPMAAAIGAQVAGAALGGILSRRKTKSQDIRPLLAEIGRSSEEQKGIIARRREDARGQTTQFGRDMEGVRSRFGESQAKLGEGYLQEAGKAIDSTGKSMMDVLRQRRLESLPEEQQALRESIVAGGGGGTGAQLQAATQLATSAGRDVGRANQEVGLQQMEQRSQALKDKFGFDTDTANKMLGLEAGTIEALYASNRQDLIAEADALIAESARRTDSLLAAHQLEANQRQAADLAAQEGRNAIIGAGVGGLSQLLGRLAESK